MSTAVRAAALGRSVPFFNYPQTFLSEEEELVAIFRDVGRRGAFILQADVARFEVNLARFLGARHALGVANATDGLLIALRAAGATLTQARAHARCCRAADGTGRGRR